MAFNGDNATSNDTQTDALDELPNSFESVNRVRCFNHTMQLSAKALLAPFSGPCTDKDADDIPDADDDDDEEEEEVADGGEDEDDDDDERDNDPMDLLSEDEQAELLRDTAAARATLQKVCFFLILYEYY